MRKYLPYIAVAVLFNLLFVITIVVDNKDLYLGFGREWAEVRFNNKIPLQLYVFSFVLSFCVALVNVFSKTYINESTLEMRLLNSFGVVVFVYLANSLLFDFLNVDVICIYNSHRGTPAISFFFGTILLLLAFFVLTEMVYSYKSIELAVKKYFFRLK